MNTGTITYKEQDETGHFLYTYEISNYHAAKILEYISQIEHEVAPWRNSKGKFVKVEDLLAKPAPRGNKEVS